MLTDLPIISVIFEKRIDYSSLSLDTPKVGNLGQQAAVVNRFDPMRIQQDEISQYR